MSDTFTAKTEDFINWAETAFVHYMNGFFADSLTNMRKSGEAACKLLIIFKYSEKIAENKIVQKSFNELIELIITDDLAPKKAINWLETIQIHGNIATHDNRVIYEQAHYCITALRLLVYWLFNEFLKTAIPSSLSIASEKLTESTLGAVTAKKAEAELKELRKEKELFEKQYRSLNAKNNEENLKTQQLNDELNKAKIKISEIEEECKKIEQLEYEISKTKAETEQWKQKYEEANFHKRKTVKLIKKISMTGIIIIAVALSILFLIKKQIFSPKLNQNEQIVNFKASQQPCDTFKVILTSLKILQDNPNISIKFEESLENYIRTKVKEKGIRIDFFYYPVSSKIPVTCEEAVNMGMKKDADLIFFGELYEPLHNDSFEVKIKFSNTSKENQINDEIMLRAFSKLTDSSTIKIFNEIENCIYIAYANHLIFYGKYSDALAVLYSAKGITKAQEVAVCALLSNCHLYLQNYELAMKEAEKLIKLQPDSAYPYAVLAEALKAKGNYSEAEKYYQKSLQIRPDNISTLVGYADFYAREEIRNLQKSKEILQQAIVYDSTVLVSWRFLGDVEYLLKNYNISYKHYLKCLKIDSADILAKQRIAEILAFYFDEPEKGLEYLYSILKSDSTNASVLFTIGNIYTSTKIKDADKAKYYLSKSKIYDTEKTNLADFGLGVAAYEKKDFKTAITYFLKLYSPDNSDLDLYDYITRTYINLKEYDNALKYLEHAYWLDSMNNFYNSNLGIFYFLAEYKHQNIDKAASYFERALKTNPYDILSLTYLGRLYYNQQKFLKSKNIYKKLYSLDPDNVDVNKGLGYFAELDSNFTEARAYYQKALKIIPDDDNTHARLAMVMMNISPKKYLEEALFHAQRAVELNSDDHENLLILSQALFLKGDYKKSSEYYYKAIAIKPSLKHAGMEQTFAEKGL
ncbi:MAG: tetratricopeptide repeat protein [Bacteroidia bacterium]|nr:tetratricopeptide repeat protein [Bacteroidia bacterium]